VTVPRNADGFVEWSQLRGDAFVEAVLDDHCLAEFVDLYRRSGFDENEIRAAVWAKSDGRWRPTWDTVAGIVDDQRAVT
jgi:hypothetical protein